MTGLVTLLAIGLAILWLLGVLSTLWRLTHPYRRTYASMLRRKLPGDPSELPSGPRAFSTWTFTSRGRDLPAWDIPGDNPSGPVVILTHGWSNSRYDALIRLAPFLPRCSRLIAWDQPGHGDAPGTSDLGVGETKDLTALIDLTTSDTTPAILYGWSMGSGVSIAAATLRPALVLGVIAQAPYRTAYTPARGVLQQSNLPWRATLWPALGLLGILRKRSPRWAGHWPDFDRAALAKRLACPLLLIHGDDDPICPLEDAQAIAKAAPDARLVLIEGAGHKGLWVDPDMKSALEREVGAFLDALPATRPAPVQ